MWDGKSKLSYVVYKENEHIQVVVFDPYYKELTNIVIPQDTFVNLARGLGKTKIKNVYNIGINEGLGGQLISETVTLSLALPVYHYVYGRSLKFEIGSFIENLKFVFFHLDSSFSFAEKVNFALQTIFSKDIKQTTINLDQTSFLRRAILVDGSEGYIKTPFMPQLVQSLFNVSDEVFTVSIMNYVGSTVDLDEIKDTFASLGGKVILAKEIQDRKNAYLKDGRKIFCELKVNDKQLAKEIKKYFQMCNLEVFDKENKNLEIFFLSLEE
ncbi:MAG: hypothetical protein N2558_01290 [Patescibacteria group bacterium]|nr:hypothetical protein [Patescibacteria group bacterium]